MNLPELSAIVSTLVRVLLVLRSTRSSAAARVSFHALTVNSVVL